MTTAAVAVSGLPAIDLFADRVDREIGRRAVQGSTPIRLAGLSLWPMIWLMYGDTAPWWTIALPGAWYVSGIAAGYGLAALQRRYRERLTTREWRRLATILVTSNGLAFGVGGFLLIPLPNEPARFGVCILLMGAAHVAAGRAGGGRSAIHTAIPMLLPLTVALLLVGGRVELVLSAAMVLTMWLIWTLSSQQNALMRSEVALGFAYADLAEQHAAAEAEARAARDLLQDALESLPVAVALWDRDDRLLLSNETYRGHLQHVAAAVTPGVRFDDALHAVLRTAPKPPVSPEREADFVAAATAVHDGRRESAEYRTDDGRWLRGQSRPTAAGGVVTTIVDITESKQREQEAQDSRAVLQSVLDNMIDGVMLFDRDFRWRFINRQLMEFQRFTPEVAFPGASGHDILRFQARRGDFGPAADEATVERRVEERAEVMRRPGGARYERRTASGRIIDFNFKPMPDGGLLAIYRDITELRESEQAAARAREELSDAIEGLADGLAVFDADLRTLVSNPAFSSVAPGFSQQQLVGRRLPDILHEMVRGGLVEGFDARNAERFVRQWESYIRNPVGYVERRDITGRWLRYHARRTRLGHYVVGFTDISEQKRRESELEEAQARTEAAQRLLDDALASMSGGVAIWGPDERLIQCNDAYRAINREIAEIVTPGTSLLAAARAAMRAQLELVGLPLDRDRVEALAQAIVTQHRTDGPPLEFATGAGTWTRLTGSRTRSGGFVSLFTDISELRQRQRELRRERDAAQAARAEAEAANQAKSTFLATMSHEIRTPMNGVLGMMDVLEHGRLDDGQKRSVAVMRESAQSLMRIIDDVLDFSKIEAGRLELEETGFSLSSLVDGAVETLRPQAESKGLALSRRIAAGSDDMLIGDPTRLRQILLNLLSNAVKFTERGRVTVQVSTTPLGAGRSRVTLSVVDTGIGLDAAAQARLFQPFSQADNSTTRQYGGTGLGLSIVRRLAQLMGGDVTVQSTAGAGATFTCSVELRAASTAAPLQALLPRTSSTPSSAGLTRPEDRPRLLVVDDHPVNREVLVQQLALIGVAADTASDGVEALAALQRTRYGAVLCDIHMPLMDGYEMVRRLRERETAGNDARLPVIAVTANALRGEEERCLAAGMDAYLAKPVALDQLRAVLARWFAVDPSQAGPAAAPAREDRDPALDRRVLAEWFGSDAGMIAGVLAKFETSARQAEANLDRAWRAGDLAALAATAHALKGAAQVVGARRLGEAAGTVENAGRAGERGRCGDGLGLLAHELRRVLEEVGRAAPLPAGRPDDQSDDGTNM